MPTLAPLITDAQVMICLTRIPRAALKDVRLADGALLMSVDDNSVQGGLTPWASLLVCIGWVQVVIQLSHGLELPIWNRII